MFNMYTQFYMEWLREIIRMNPSKLSNNEIGISGNEIVNMAQKLLNLMLPHTGAIV